MENQDHIKITACIYFHLIEDASDYPIFYPRREIIFDTTISLKENMQQILVKLEKREDISIEYFHAYFYDADQ